MRTWITKFETYVKSMHKIHFSSNNYDIYDAKITK